MCLSANVQAQNSVDDLVKGVFKNEIVTFRIRQAEIIEPQDDVDYKAQNQPALAITLEVINHTKTKKISLQEEFQYELTDEFGNTYRLLSVPDHYERPIFFPNKHFPSIYPEEIFSETIFFEVPIEKSETLFLKFDATPLGISNAIQLSLPCFKIGEKEKSVVQELQSRNPIDNDLAIILPKNGAAVMPGEIVPLRIKLPADIDPPDRIYILSPDYLFEDTNLSSRYDLRIPPLQKLGPFIVVVMAMWNNDPKEIVISKSFTLKVVDPAKACMGECMNKRRNIRK